MYKIISEKIGKWLKDYLLKNNKDGFVLGVSGGIDSAVLAMILKEQNIKNELIHINYDQNTIKQAENEVINFFKNSNHPFKIININIQDTYNGLVSLLIDESNFKKELLKTNIKSRLRELIFYNIANIKNYLVIGTINKTEFNIGYFTKNSSIGDILPFAELTKNDIRNIGMELGIPRDFLHHKADGCIDKKYAEDEWGIPESEMELILQGKKTKSEYYTKYEALNHNTNHKRIFPPIFKL